MLLLVVTLVLLLSALYLDLHYQRIPNKLCLSAFVLALLLQSYLGQWQGVGQALLGAGLALLLLVPAYVFRWLGAGDVKLMVAVGAFSGPSLLLWAVLYGIIFGTITSFILALYKVGWSGIIALSTGHFIKSSVKTSVKASEYGSFADKTADKKSVAPLQVPYAPALALGWLLACYLDVNIHALVVNWHQAFFT